jgi:catechol 2,3-dioxygenase-like lactoylglutathione lyase family enzyme
MTGTPLIGLSHLDLSVSDRHASAEWYASVLGFEIRGDRWNEVARLRWTHLVHPCGLSVGLVEHPDNPGDPFDERRAGLDHVSFAVASPSAEQGTKRQWHSGVCHSPSDHDRTCGLQGRGLGAAPQRRVAGTDVASSDRLSEAEPPPILIVWAITGDEGSQAVANEAAVERIEVARAIAAEPSTIFDVLRDPQGHVSIDASGMLMSASGSPATAAGDSFVVHMDRDALRDFPLGLYDVTVTFVTYEQDREIAWGIGALDNQFGHIYGYRLEPIEQGTIVTQYYDWSGVDDDLKAGGIFPVIPESALRATLGILARTVAPGVPRPSVETI